MNSIKQKIQSDSGASITIALFLFLVCTVLCSVILAAATTASGRMSQMAENDQRYYGVASAVEFLRDLMEDKAVTVVYQTTLTEKRTYSSSGNVTEPTTISGESSSKKCVIENKTGDETTADDIVNAVVISDSSELFNSIAGDAAYFLVYPSSSLPGYNGPDPDSGEITETHTDQEPGDDPEPGIYTIIDQVSRFSFSPDTQALNNIKVLNIEVDEQLFSDGTLILSVFNKKNADNSDSEPGKDRFTLKMTFEADKSESTDRLITEGMHENPRVDSSGYVLYDMKTKTITTIKTTVRWNLVSIKPA